MSPPIEKPWRDAGDGVFVSRRSTRGFFLSSCRSANRNRSDRRRAFGAFRWDRKTALEVWIRAYRRYVTTRTSRGRRRNQQCTGRPRGAVESEFDSIEKVLQHLLDTTDNIEYRLGTVSDSRQEALRPFQQHTAMQDALADLKAEAIRHGVKACVCVW